MKKVLLLILSTLILTGCTKKYDLYKLPEEAKITINEDLVIKVYEDVYLYDLIKDKNVEITTKNDLIDTNGIGNKKVTIDLLYEEKKYKYIINYEVKDITPPKILSAASTKYVKVMEDVYPCEGAFYVDNYDGEAICSIEGEYDLTNIGDYKVSYLVTDSSGNEARKDLTIKVVSEYPPSNNTNNNTSGPKLDISTVINNHKNDKTMIGIDVSKWQGNIDYEKVKEAGVEFVIMRIGVNSSKDKDIDIDGTFKDNIKNAKAAGLKVGVYLYSTAITKEKAREHAKWVIDNLDNESLDFPIAYDWENWKWFVGYKLSLHDINEIFNTFAEYLKKHNYETMLYSSKYYLENIWDNKYEYPVWLAHYTNNTNYQGKYIIWQMANNGRVPGINGDVDIDIYYKQ